MDVNCQEFGGGNAPWVKVISTTLTFNLLQTSGGGPNVAMLRGGRLTPLCSHLFIFSNNPLGVLKKSKESYELSTGRKMSWEDFIWMKCMRRV